MSRTRDWHVEVMEAWLLETEQGTCECCGHVGNMVDCDSRRMDVDARYKLCAPCATEHHEYWDEMWDDYWSSRL